MTKKRAAASREPAHRHPSLGLAPADMAAGYPAAAEDLRLDKATIAAEAMEAAAARDPELRGRFSDRGLADLLHDAEMLTERLAMCLAGGDMRWLPEFAEWMSPILRRRGVAQADVAALAEGIREIVARRLGAGRDGAGRRRAGRRDGSPAQERAPGRRHPQAQRPAALAVPRRLSAMTIKWVKADPLVLKGEPFCYGTRLTVRQVLELRRAGCDARRLLADYPELRIAGLAHAYHYAAGHRDLYAEFFEADGSLAGPGLLPEEAALLPETLRIPGVVVAGKPAQRGQAPKPGR